MTGADGERIARQAEEKFQADRVPIMEPAVLDAGAAFLHFLGTGGNPLNLITQERQNGGMYLRYGARSLYIDPGPGAIVHAARARLPLSWLDAVFISHGHTDHYLGAGAIIEAMCRIMRVRRGRLLLPAQMIASGQIDAYHRGELASSGYPGGPEVEVLAHGRPVPLPGGAVLTPVRTDHGIEGYGFRFEWEGIRVGYTSDTRFIQTFRDRDGTVRPVEAGTKLDPGGEVVDANAWIQEAMGDVDLLVANVSFFHLFAHRQFTAVGLRHLLRAGRVGRCILTHFDPSIGSPHATARSVAAWLEEETGVSCTAAWDGMRVELIA